LFPPPDQRFTAPPATDLAAAAFPFEFRQGRKSLQKWPCTQNSPDASAGYLRRNVAQNLLLGKIMEMKKRISPAASVGCQNGPKKTKENWNFNRI
jgi:hypothetical protein